MSSRRSPRTTRLLVACGVVVSMLSIAPAGAAPHDLDPAFGDGGIARVNVGSSGDTRWQDRAYAAARQPDGKIVLAGSTERTDGSTDVVLLRLTAAGALDPTFGTGGVVISDWTGAFDVANGVAIQQDGKIVVGGIADLDLGVARYLPDGSLDGSFGSGGVRVTRVGNTVSSGHAVALDSSGRIVLAGVSDSRNSSDFVIARYTAGGALDTTFSGDGVQLTSFGSERAAIYAIAMANDGAIIAAGATEDDLNADMVVARYRTDGALDTGFASSGIRRIDFANDYDYAYAVTVQPDGKIVAAGQAGTTSGSHFGLVRLTAAGALDPSFDGDGRATTAFDGFFGGKATDARVGGVAVMGNGLVAAGTAGTGTRRIALARYGFDGRPDTGFGTGGAAATAIGSFDDEANAVLVGGDRSILAVGYSYGDGSYDLVAARYIGHAVPPSAPRDPTASSRGLAPGEIRLTWAPPATSPAGPVVGYRVYRGISESALTPIATLADVRSFLDTGHPDDTAFFYAVSAINQVGEGPTTTPVRAVTRGRPTEPTRVKAVGDEGQITVTWSIPDDPGTQPITGYRVSVSPDGGSFAPLADTATTSFVHTGLADVDTRCYQVVAINAFGPGPASATACATTRGLPTPPRALVVDGGLRRVTLAWSEPADPGTRPITAYRIYRRSGASGEVVAATVGDVRGYVDMGLSDDTAYAYRITAINDLGEGPSSPLASTRTFGRPSAVRSLRASPGASIGEVALSWTPPGNDGGTPITRYVIDRRPSGGSPTRLGESSGPTTFVDTSAQPGVRYFYRVTPVNAAGEGIGADVCGRAFPWVEALGCL